MKIGYGGRVVTPDVGCFLSGYGVYLERYSEKILDDLKVRVIFLEDKEGNKLLLCSFDLIGFSVEFADTLRREISETFDIQVSNIFISCIHTHSGPATLPLQGMEETELDLNYMCFLKKRLKEAVKEAITSTERTEIRWNIEEIEPIGFNRVTRTLHPMDLNLGLIVFSTGKGNIYLINYACHAVTLGVNREISADFPGRIIKEIENRGHKGIFFQGFCGDIDPFVNKVKWASGTEVDIEFYGKHIAERIFKIERGAHLLKGDSIGCIEKRIKVPLQVKSKEQLKKEKEFWIKSRNNKNWTKFSNWWYKRAIQKLPALLKSPYLENIPVWVGRIGEVNIVGYPGEVFCEIGLKLRKKYSPLFTIGYANGDIGYIPTGKAYKNKNDYACYTAPLFYHYCFPFSPEVEGVFLKEAEKILKKRD